MTTPFVTIHNAETNEIVTREMDSAELAKHEEIKKQAEEKAAQLQAHETAKLAAQAKLEALGLTVDDLKALGL